MVTNVPEPLNNNLLKVINKSAGQRARVLSDIILLILKRFLPTDLQIKAFS